MLASLFPVGGLTQNITVDGTLSPAQTLAGPNYSITENLGKQVGGNLFHSFGTFGLVQGESANFSGPATVINVIGRVTGGNISSINGAINSNISGANVYLINPAGMVFGPSATVNVSGAFHASTADYIRMSDGARFQATNPSGSTFSAAPPAAFGFLTASPPALTVNGATLSVPSGQTLGLVGGPVTLNSATLSAPTGTIYVTSASGVGEVPTEPRNTAAQTVKGFGPIDINTGSLVSVGDPINLGSGGSVFVTAGAMTMDAVSVVNADNFGAGMGGSVTINAGTLSISNGSSISSSTAAAGIGGKVSVAVSGQLSIDGAVSSIEGDGSLNSGIFANAHSGSTGNGGEAVVMANSLSITNGGRISSSTVGSATGAAGTVFVTVPGRLSISGTAMSDGTSSQIASVSRGRGAGAAGRIVVNAGTLSMTKGGQISASTTGNGNAGSVEITVAGDLAIDGTGSSTPTIITSNQRLRGAAGNAGQVTINAATMSLTNGGQISSSTAGVGQAGTVLVNVAGRLSADGIGLPRPVGPSNSGIGSITLPGSLGASGQVIVKAGTLSLTNGGAILSSTAGAGAGGLISVTTTGLVTLDGVGSAIAASAEAGATGNAGSVRVSAAQLTIASGAEIASTTAGKGSGGSVTVGVTGDLVITGNGVADTQIATSATGLQSGPAGAVNVQAASLTIANGGRIASSSAGPGRGGDISIAIASDAVLTGAATQVTALSTGSGDAGSITLSATNLNMSAGATISTEANSANGGNITLKIGNFMQLADSEITTSVHGAAGNGGNIFIDPEFLVLQRSRIVAEAVEGQGGNITIVANQYLPSADSVVSASSQLGVSGSIEIVGPRVDLNGSLVVLPSELRDAVEVLRNSCAARGALPRSSLTNAGRGGLPQDPEVSVPALYLADRDVLPTSPGSQAEERRATQVSHLQLSMQCH